MFICALPPPAFAIPVPLSGALSTPPRSPAESARVRLSPPDSGSVRWSPADSGGLTGLNRTVLPLPKVCIDQSPVQLSPVWLSLVQGRLWWTLPDSGQL